MWEGLYNNPSTMAHLNCLVNGPRSIVSEAPYSTVDLIRGYCICEKSAAQLARGYVDIDRRKPRHRQRASWQRRQLSSQGKSYAARGLLMASWVQLNARVTGSLESPCNSSPAFWHIVERIIGIGGCCKVAVGCCTIASVYTLHDNASTPEGNEAADGCVGDHSRVRLALHMTHVSNGMTPSSLVSCVTPF